MKRTILSFIFCLLFSSVVRAAVVPVTTATANGSGINSIAVSIAASGSDRFLVASVHAYVATVTDCDYGGQPLSLIDVVAHFADVNVEIWGLVAPTVGTATLTCNLSSSSSAVVLGVVILTGVDSITPYDTPGQDQTTGSSNSLNVTIGLGGRGFDVVTLDTATPGPTPPPLYADVSDWLHGSASTVSAPGTQTMAWSWIGYNYNSHIAIAINAATAGGALRYPSPMVIR